VSPGPATNVASVDETLVCRCALLQKEIGEDYRLRVGWHWLSDTRNLYRRILPWCTLYTDGNRRSNFCITCHQLKYR